jgi:hypothetical protein
MFNPQFCLFRNSSCACARLRDLCHHSSRQRITSLGHPNGGGLGTRFRASEQSKLGSANYWRAWETSLKFLSSSRLSGFVPRRSSSEVKSCAKSVVLQGLRNFAGFCRFLHITTPAKQTNSRCSTTQKPSSIRYACGGASNQCP